MTIKVDINMGSYAFTVSAEDLDKVQQHMAAVRSMEPASEWKGSIEIHFVLHGGISL
jgi:hypothetical protein